MVSPAMSRAQFALRRVRSSHLHSRWVRYESSGPGPGGRTYYPPPPPLPRRSLARVAAIAALTIFGAAGAGGAYAYLKAPAPEPISDTEKPELIFEKARKRARSKEDGKDSVSLQHVQVKKSWENPGVYAWGSNTGRVVAPDSKEPIIKSPRRIRYFDGQILRDLKLENNFGAAVNEKGDLVQWGVGFSPDATTPEVTLKGKDLTKITVSRDRVIGLSSNGQVYSLPVSKADQSLSKNEAAASSSWFPSLWSGSQSSSSTTYRLLKPSGLSWNEKITDIQSGLDHCLLLTSKGRVFSSAASSSEFPTKGQLGVPGLTWKNRPSGVPYDYPHEVSTLGNVKIKSIAAGDYHSLALSKDGHIFTFGDNTFGQLGFQPDIYAPYIDTPCGLPINQLYTGTNFSPKVTSIAAGGLATFFTVDATKTRGQSSIDLVPSRDVGRVVAETWACGEGIHGSLGNGKWTHVSSGPAKIKALSGLQEYNEATNGTTPIRLSKIVVGGDHAAAILDNRTHTAVSSDSETDTHFGSDVLFWGGNEHWQLGTGKRANLNVPTHIGALESSGGALDNRLQVTPRTKVKLGNGRTVSVEQRVECGRGVSAVYSAA
ncbi:regulator of chromosome condensation 1/beta-lactamase-inhibitor protein II [Cladorrhinum sp. PSN259]|nr:regulator of chromosome condensation 1/beta-lactamase-inhibitor protein II [Cladorrhinum sp. PSN259]